MLTVLSSSGGPALKDTSYRCRCHCGTELDLPARAVKHGEVRSCGCQRRQTKPIVAGTRFGQLTVEADLGKSCRCRCDCGQVAEVSKKGLKSGNNQSCGCLRAVRARERSELTTPVGAIFGRLTVKENRQGTCLCVCDHDGEGETKEVEVATSSLHNGRTRSCGCLRKERTATLRVGSDLTDKVFGRLRVVSFQGRYSRCVCECGRTTLVLSTKLRNGRTRSCGCLQRETAGAGQLTQIAAGTRFGKLLVMTTVRVLGRGVQCFCRCDCDSKEIKVSARALLAGKIQSCGCLRQEAYQDGTVKGRTQTRSLRNVYEAYRAAAQRVNVPFTLTRDDVRKLLEVACHDCQRKAGTGRRNTLVCAIAAKGYVAGNVIALCTQCRRKA